MKQQRIWPPSPVVITEELNQIFFCFLLVVAAIVVQQSGEYGGDMVVFSVMLRYEVILTSSLLAERSLRWRA